MTEGMKSRIALLVAALLVLVAGAGGVWWWRQQGAEQDAAAKAALSAFAAAWVAKDVSTVPFAATAVRDIADRCVGWNQIRLRQASIDGPA